MTPEMLGSHRSAYDALFQHPVARTPGREYLETLPPQAYPMRRWIGEGAG